MTAELISESQALRVCNLPDTPHWREWLRRNLQSTDVSTGKLYDRALVADVAGKLAPMQPRQSPVRTDQDAGECRVSGAVDSGVAPRPKRNQEPLANRLAPTLETR